MANSSLPLTDAQKRGRLFLVCALGVLGIFLAISLAGMLVEGANPPEILVEIWDTNRIIRDHIEAQADALFSEFRLRIDFNSFTAGT